jgi:hypothetical protein
MAGRKPKFKVVLKSKNTGTSQGLVAIWESEDKPGLFSGKFENEIKQIILQDGTVINPDQVYVNLYVNDPEPGGKHVTPSHVNPATGNAHWSESDGTPAVSHGDTPF